MPITQRPTLASQNQQGQIPYRPRRNNLSLLPTIMKTIVTGGAGFIGSHVVDHLIAEGHTVTVIDNLSTGKRDNVNPEAELRVLDIATDDINAVFDEISPDWVFHLAARPRVVYAQNYPVEAHLANVTGTVNVLNAARLTNAKRVVVSSSSSVYGRYQHSANEIHTPANPVNMYGWQKLAAEMYAKMFHECYQMPIIALRYFNVYGARMTADAYGTVIGKFLEMRKSDQPLTIEGNGQQLRDFTWVDDVANANLLAAESKLDWGVFNIGCGTPTSIYAIAKLIGGKLKYTKPRPNDVMFTCADNGWAREALHWQPQTSIERGMEILLQQHGLIQPRVYAKRRSRPKSA